MMKKGTGPNIEFPKVEKAFLLFICLFLKLTWRLGDVTVEDAEVVILKTPSH